MRRRPRVPDASRRARKSGFPMTRTVFLRMRLVHAKGAGRDAGKAEGRRQAADLVRPRPDHPARLETRRALAAHPARHEGGDDEMARHLAIAVAVDHLDMVVEADDRGRDADLFVELAQGGLLERFAHFDETAGKREQAFGRRPVARGEQNAPVADDRKGRRKQRMLGIGPLRHVTPSEARRRRKKALPPTPVLDSRRQTYWPPSMCSSAPFT